MSHCGGSLLEKFDLQRVLLLTDASLHVVGSGEAQVTPLPYLDFSAGPRSHAVEFLFVLKFLLFSAEVSLSRNTSTRFRRKSEMRLFLFC